MKKLINSLLAILISSISLAQLQNANWCFGNQAKLNFNTTIPTPSSCSITATPGAGTGIASVSSNTGELLFYTNGNLVWGKDNSLMPNGNHLFGGSIMGANSQYTIIVPKPGAINLYYVFTACSGIPSSSLEGHDGIYYSVVDMDLNSGNGDIISGLKNIPLKNQAGIPIDYDSNTGLGLQAKNVKLTSTLNQAGNKIWATFMLRFDNAGVPERYLYSYLISSVGINDEMDGVSPQPTATSIIPTINYTITPMINQDQAGLVKISPDGSRLCDASVFDVNLYKFNNQTGLALFNSTIYNDLTFENVSGLGVEFSPNSQLVYFTTAPATIFQQGRPMNNTEPQTVKIFQNNIGNSYTEVIGEYTVDDEVEPNVVTPIPAQVPGGLQLAIDGKIYVCVGGFGSTRLGAIRQPNLASLACDFVPFEVQLVSGTRHWGGLPQWVHTTAAKWPKAYLGKDMGHITKLDNQNLIAYYASNYGFNDGGNMTPNLNHTGELPGAPPVAGIRQYSFHYTSSGLTNWLKNDLFPIFSLNNGTIQMGSFNGPDIGPEITNISFYNKLTGVIANSPSIVPSGHRILAETTGGGYITLDATYNLYLNTPTGSTSGIPLGINSIYSSNFKFNPISNKLFCFLFINNSYILRIYSVSNNNISLDVEKQLQPFNAGFYNEGIVNNNDEVFVQNNQQIYKIDYSGANTNAIYNLVTIPGVINSNISLSNSNNPYTDNKCLFGKPTIPGLGKMYLLDLIDYSSKKIDVVNCSASSYLLDGNNIYLGVNSYLTPTFSVGNVQVNQLVPNKLQMNLFKFNLNTDFSRSAVTQLPIAETPTKLTVSQSFEASISPNPSSDNIKITITTKDKTNSDEGYTLQFKNRISNTTTVKRGYISGSLIDVSRLEKGFYYVEITNGKGEKIITKFIKQ